MDLGDFPLKSIGLPAAVFRWEADQHFHVNAAFRVLMGGRLGPDKVPLFEDLDALLGGQLQDFNPESGDSIIQQIKIGRKRHSFEFTVGLIARGETNAVLLLGVDKSEVVKAEAKLSSYVGIIEENNRELQRLANTDPLTEAANRRALYYAKANGRSCVIPYSAELFEKRDTTLIARVDNLKSRESGSSSS